MLIVKNRILVIDNDLDTCRDITAHMQGEHTDVCCIASVSEALDSIMKVDYCLIILSNQLPGISGMEMLRIIRLTQRIPINVLTAPLFPNDKVALFRAGADAVIEKPFDIDMCIAQAEALIQLYSNSDVDRNNIRDGQISFGTELVIVPHFRQTFVDGKAISLTRKEFALLLHFARHPKRVFSREQLYASIWGSSFAAGGDETVRVHIQTLRKKLEAEGKHFIHNVWGVGYKFAPPNDSD